MESRIEKVVELDIVEAIGNGSLEGFMVDFNLTASATTSKGSLLIHNGIVMLLCRGDGGRIVIDGKE